MALFQYNGKDKVFRRLKRGELGLVWEDVRGDQVKIDGEVSIGESDTYYGLEHFSEISVLQSSLYALETLEQTLEKGWILPNGDFVSGKRHQDILAYGLGEDDIPVAERIYVCVTPQGWRDSGGFDQFFLRKMGSAQQHMLRMLGRCVRDQSTRDRSLTFAGVFPNGNARVFSLVEAHKDAVQAGFAAIEKKRVQVTASAFVDFSPQ
jgi:hypothetical protein